jgi:hypothetical protein
MRFACCALRAAGEISRWAERSDIAADCLGDYNEEVLRGLLARTV